MFSSGASYLGQISGSAVMITPATAAARKLCARMFENHLFLGKWAEQTLADARQ
jgi:hypothetical protein